MPSLRTSAGNTSCPGSSCPPRGYPVKGSKSQPCHGHHNQHCPSTPSSIEPSEWSALIRTAFVHGGIAPLVMDERQLFCCRCRSSYASFRKLIKSSYFVPIQFFAYSFLLLCQAICNIRCSKSRSRYSEAIFSWKDDRLVLVMASRPTRSNLLPLVANKARRVLPIVFGRLQA